MRLFIAVPFEQDTLNRIESVQQRLKAVSDGSYPARENFHLTLASLGETSPERVTELMQVFESVPFQKTEIQFTAIKRFDHREKGIVYLEAVHTETLKQYRRQLCSVLANAGIPYDTQTFTPHLTLARKVALPEQRIEFEPINAAVNRAVLYVSEEINHRRVYTELDSVS